MEIVDEAGIQQHLIYPLEADFIAFAVWIDKLNLPWPLSEFRDWIVSLLDASKVFVRVQGAGDAGDAISVELTALGLHGQPLETIPNLQLTRCADGSYLSEPIVAYKAEPGEDLAAEDQAHFAQYTFIDPVTLKARWVDRNLSTQVPTLQMYLDAPGGAEVVGNQPDDDMDDYTPGYDMDGTPGITVELQNGVPVMTQPQELLVKIPVRVPGADVKAGSKLLFKIQMRNGTSLPGFCMNGGDQTENDLDYSFEAAGNVAEQEFEYDQDQKMFVATLFCKDFGGACTVEVSGQFELAGKTIVVEPTTMQIPVDKDDDGLADVWEEAEVGKQDDQGAWSGGRWEQAYGNDTQVTYATAQGVPFTLDFDKDDVFPTDRELVGTDDDEPPDPDADNRDGGIDLGPHGAFAMAGVPIYPLENARQIFSERGWGDSFTSAEEYRGFVGIGPAGGHLRLSPVRKEMLVEVEVMQLGADIVGKYAATAAAARARTATIMGIVKQRYAVSAGVDLYFVIDDVYGARVPYRDISSIDIGRQWKAGCRDVGRASEADYSRFLHVCFVDTISIEPQLYGRSEAVWDGCMISLRQHGSIEDSDITNPFIAQTAAHELGHCVRCQHHNVGAEWAHYLMYGRVSLQTRLFCQGFEADAAGNVIPPPRLSIEFDAGIPKMGLVINHAVVRHVP